MFILKKMIKEKTGITLNNRQIDDLLLYVSKEENIFL